MRNPIISVIIPVYNAEKYLQHCIESILNQSFTEFELLLIDDGSKDNSGNICEEYEAKDSRVKVFHKDNGGASSARNLGMNYAKGIWMTFCDADDVVSENWLEVFFENCEGVDLVISGFKIRRFNTKTIVSVGFDDIGESKIIVEKLLATTMPGVLWNKLFKSEIIRSKNLRLDPKIVFCEDEEFLMRYLCECRRVRSVNKPTYFYTEPDWSKYYRHWKSASTFLRVASIFISRRKIGLKNDYSKLKEITKFLLIGILKNPLKSIEYIKLYFKCISG